MPQPIAQWFQYADGEIHELTTEEVQERHNKSVRLLERSLRVYASSKGLKCSVQKTDDGVRFCLWQSSETNDFLPADVMAMDNSPLVWDKGGYGTISHARCTHPKTKNARQACRARRKKAAS